ncbi:MAG: hypothetical protein Q9214_005512 [Letrouitia sp. 1 TL-2023]
MLSAFTARPIVEHRQRDKSKIESILAYGDRLLVGLNTGSLRIYRINETISDSKPAYHGHPSDNQDRPSSSSQPKAVDLMREEEKFSKHKIEQLAIVREANLLISLSNNIVSSHDLQSYELQESLLKTRGASAFAITSNIVKDTSTGVPSIVSRLAVAVKRRLILWSWHDSELSAETLELSLVTGIKSLTWLTGTKLVAGLSSSYVIVDVTTTEVRDIVGPGSIGGTPGQDGGRFGGVGVSTISYMGLAGTAPKPLASKLGEMEMLLAKDINTLFIDTGGNSLGRRQVPWAVAPEAIGYSYPYLLALQATKGTLEVRNPESLSLLQTISLPSANQLHIPQPNISLAHAGKGFLVHSERCIWQMVGQEYDAQIEALIEKGRLDEAISLLEMLEDALLKDKPSQLRETKMLKAQTLFDQKRWRESFDLFTEVEAPPERVIRLFPPSISGTGLPIRSDDKPHTGRQEEDSVLVKDTQESDDNNRLSLKQGNQDASSTMESNTSMNDASSVRTSTTPRHDADVQLDGKDLKAATAELRPFLVSVRTKLQRYLSPDGTLKQLINDKSNDLNQVSHREAQALLFKQTSASDEEERQALLATAKLVDTTLFRAYMFASPSLAGPLFRIDNFCDPEVVNEKLIETGRYNDLVDFFYGKRLHRQALELLKKFGEEDRKDEKEQIAPQLAGPERTVAYLQSLPSEMIDLILQFAEWPLKTNSELGMEIFVADSENAETLPRQGVLEFLQRIDENLAVRYLEHIIHELNDSTPGFHQRLVEIYIEGLKSTGFATQEKRDKWKTDALAFLRSSRNYDAYKALRQLPSDGEI